MQQERADFLKQNTAEDLAYFVTLLERKPPDTPEHSAKKWNQRAEFWQKERVHHRKGDDRVASAMHYLTQRGVLQPSYSIADIGCGPGRFVAAFAKQVHDVVGLDISEKMVAYGMEHIHRAGVTNAVLHTCDFQSLDVEQAGYTGAFDLIFSSMTPAIHGMNGLLKSMQMSRRWCFHITHLSGRNYLREQIQQEVFGYTKSQQWTGQWFYALVNVLFLLGYHPETTYEAHHQDNWVHPDAEYVEFLMEHMLPVEEMTKENAEKILNWLLAHQNEDGLVHEVTDASYGRILWDVQNRVERSLY